MKWRNTAATSVSSQGIDQFIFFLPVSFPCPKEKVLRKIKLPFFCQLNSEVKKRDVH
jgi:hypothetical protein